MGQPTLWCTSENTCERAKLILYGVKTKHIESWDAIIWELNYSQRKYRSLHVYQAFQASGLSQNFPEFSQIFTWSNVVHICTVVGRKHLRKYSRMQSLMMSHEKEIKENNLHTFSKLYNTGYDKSHGENVKILKRVADVCIPMSKVTDYI